MIKNPSSNKGDADSIPGLGIKIPLAPRQRNLPTATTNRRSRRAQKKKKSSFNDVDWAPSIDRKEVNQEASVKNQRYLKLMTTMTYEDFK